jgi:hypothetical protein
LAECNVEEVLRHAGAVALRTRRFCLSDMHIGRKVRGPASRYGESVGRISAWTIADEATGRLASITVEWPDGSTAEFDPAEERVFPAEWPDE